MKKQEKKKYIPDHLPIRKYVRRANCFCETSIVDGKQIQKWDTPIFGEKKFDWSEKKI